MKEKSLTSKGGAIPPRIRFIKAISVEKPMPFFLNPKWVAIVAIAPVWLGKKGKGTIHLSCKAENTPIAVFIA